MANRYENLKLDTLSESGPRQPQKIIWLTQGMEEVIILTLAKLDNGHWVWGYSVEWASGRASSAPPSTDNGEFMTERAATLYGIGYMQSYGEYFTSGTRASLDAAEHKYQINKLFGK